MKTPEPRVLRWQMSRTVEQFRREWDCPTFEYERQSDHLTMLRQKFLGLKKLLRSVA